MMEEIRYAIEVNEFEYKLILSGLMTLKRREPKTFFHEDIKKLFKKIDVFHCWDEELK